MGYGEQIGSFVGAIGQVGYSVKEASHAIGELSKAVGGYSHAEGCYTKATGHCSHAEGCSSSLPKDLVGIGGFTKNGYEFLKADGNWEKVELPKKQITIDKIVKMSICRADTGEEVFLLNGGKLYLNGGSFC